MNNDKIIQEIIDLLNGPNCPDVVSAIAHRDNVVYLLEELFESYTQLDDRLTQINDLTDY